MDRDRGSSDNKMSKTFVASSTFCAFMIPAALFAAGDDSVSFQKDVQPLIQKHCLVCHGPEQQMNSFRLDRRSAAFRGGTRTVIVPGSSESSRLYLRLIGNQFGNRMPPTGPLQPQEIAIFKKWIDEGARWPDALASEPNLTPADPQATRMVEALRAGEMTTFLKLAKADPKALNLRGPGGATPFMFAALYSDTVTVQSLIRMGADPNRKDDAGATALMWATPDTGKMRVLLESGANVNERSSDGRTPLVIAAVQAGSAPAVKLLLEHGADANNAGGKPTDLAPLREASNAGDVDMMKLLIDHGANIRRAGYEVLSESWERHCQKCVEMVEKSFDADSYSRALLEVAVYADPQAIKFMLDHGADVNARDEDGRTALIFAANSNGVPLKTVKLLMDRGADVNAKTSEGWTPLYVAELHGETPVVEALRKAGAKPAGDPPPLLHAEPNNAIPMAMQKAIPLLQEADFSFTKKSGCTSCHNEGLADMALGMARKTGFHLNEQLASDEVKAVVAFWDEWRERLLQGVGPGGPAYTLVGLDAMSYKPDLTTDAITREIRMKQLADGHWTYGCGGSRAPLCGTEISNTALSLHALQLYTPKPLRSESDRAVAKAALWLAQASANENEDLTFRVLGLKWAGTDKSVLQKAAGGLLAAQRADGGWSDIPSMSSTAYATGETLVALHEAGIPSNDAAYQRGVGYLLSTQLEDGSWYVKTHSLAAQPYFDVGFPHGRDQWISASASSWAIMALSYAAEGHPLKTRRSGTAGELRQ
jgi:ankyrin repeat protein